MKTDIVSRVVLLLLSVTTLVSCASVQPVAEAPGYSRVDAENLPVPTSSFLLQPLDRLSVRVFGQPDLDRDLEISPAGAIKYPLIGLVQAAGITPTELERQIEARLSAGFLRAPSVNVVLTGDNSRQIYVGGEVTRSGSLAYRNDLTLQQVVVLSGGLTEFAKVDDVLVQRTIEGQTYIGVYNIAAIQRGNYTDPRLFPGDTVIVGDSPSRRQILQLLQITSAVLQPLILIERVGVI